VKTIRHTATENNDHIKFWIMTKDPAQAAYVHIRLGLNEAPERLMCKCRPMIKYFYTIQVKIMDTRRL
jgi:hypothetical protein